MTVLFLFSISCRWRLIWSLQLRSYTWRVLYYFMTFYFSMMYLLVSSYCWSICYYLACNLFCTPCNSSFSSLMHAVYYYYLSFNTYSYFLLNSSYFSCINWILFSIIIFRFSSNCFMFSDISSLKTVINFFSSFYFYFSSLISLLCFLFSYSIYLYFALVSNFTCSISRFDY